MWTKMTEKKYIFIKKKKKNAASYNEIEAKYLCVFDFQASGRWLSEEMPVLGALVHHHRDHGDSSANEKRVVLPWLLLCC